VAGDFCAKLVERYLFLALQQLKICTWDNKVVVLFHVANRAITFVDADSLMSFEFKPDGATVAATLHRNHLIIIDLNNVPLTELHRFRPAR
jgi:hypothetical protein